MVKEDLPASYELEEGEEGYRMLQYGDTTFCNVLPYKIGNLQYYFAEDNKPG